MCLEVQESEGVRTGVQSGCIGVKVSGDSSSMEKNKRCNKGCTNVLKCICEKIYKYIIYNNNISIWITKKHNRANIILLK